jgi:hypothetical protein
VPEANATISAANMPLPSIPLPTPIVDLCGTESGESVVDLDEASAPSRSVSCRLSGVPAERIEGVIQATDSLEASEGKILFLFCVVLNWPVQLPTPTIFISLQDHACGALPRLRVRSNRRYLTFPSL